MHGFYSLNKIPMVDTMTCTGNFRTNSFVGTEGSRSQIFDRKAHMLKLDSFQSTLRRRLSLHKATRRQWTGGHWGSLYMR